MNEIAAFCNSYPSIDVKYDVKNKNKQATAVAYGDTITITVHVERDGDEDSDEEEGEAGTLFAAWTTDGGGTGGWGWMGGWQQIAWQKKKKDGPKNMCI
jgi:hypothetical protein